MNDDGHVLEDVMERRTYRDDGSMWDRVSRYFEGERDFAKRHEEPRRRGIDAYEDDWFRMNDDYWRGREQRGRRMASGPLDWAGDRVNYAGVGPQGYVRSDSRIYEDVCEAMTVHPALDATDVTVTVQGAEVTLEGTVGSRGEKRLAEALAEGTRGVRDVHNRLKVKPRTAPDFT